MSQNAFSVITRVKAGQVDALQKVLDSYGNPLPPTSPLRFADVETLHFASLVLLDRDTNFPPSLVLEISYDGDQAAHLDDLCRNAAGGLRAVFGHCEGYGASADTDVTALKTYLLSKSVKSPAFYVGCYGQSIDSIRNAMNTRQAVEDFLDKAQQDMSLQGMSQRQIFGQIRKYLYESPVMPEYTATETHARIVWRSNVSKWAWIALA